MIRRVLPALTLPAIALLTVLGGPAGAGAHTAEIRIQASTLVYQQIPGISVDHDNQVTISQGTESSGPYYVIEDPNSTGTFFPAQCTPLNTEQTSVRCPASGITGLYVRTGNAAKAEPSRVSNITITAATPAMLSGGSATVDAGRSTITAAPVGGNVLYGSLGGGTLDSRNGGVDFIHTCPPANTLEADIEDILIPDCAVIPEPPGTPAPKPKAGPSVPPPTEPGSSTGGGGPTTELPPAPTAVVAISYRQPQALLGRRYLLLTISAATALTVRVHASIALPGSKTPLALVGRVVKLSGPGAGATLRLLLPRRALAPLRRAFARHRRLYATVSLDAADPATSSSFSLARRVRVVP